MATHEPEALLAIAEARVAWVLAHPHISAWLKQALRSAQDVDPIALQNDVEMLRHLVALRSQAQVEMAAASSLVE